MKEVTELLPQLATKLGTTVEYLWRVLVRQAPLEGVINLIQYGILAFCIYLYLKTWPWAIERADDSDGMSFLLPGILAIPLIILAGMAIFSLPDTAAAFFNPEYWALQRVLQTIEK